MKIRVCLSGSGFRFPAHVGALAAVEDNGYEVIEISGTSGGSIVGSMYACGYTAAELRDITLNVDFSKMLEFNFGALFSFGYCNGNKLVQFFESLIGRTTMFKDTNIPLHVIASDLTNSTGIVIDKDNDSVVEAIRASSAVPFIYTPIRKNGMWLVDGGITSNTPIECLENDDVLRLGVKLTSTLDTTPVNSPVDILARTANLMFENLDNSHISSGKLSGALFSFVNTGSVGSFDTKMTKETRQSLYNIGYKQTDRVLRMLESVAQKQRSFTTNYTEINRLIYG